MGVGRVMTQDGAGENRSRDVGFVKYSLIRTW